MDDVRMSRRQRKRQALARELAAEWAREQAMLLAEGRSAAEVQEQLRELYERGLVVPHRVRWWQRVAVVERMTAIALPVTVALCWVGVGVLLARGFWLLAGLAAGAFVFGALLGSRDRRVEL